MSDSPAVRAPLDPDEQPILDKLLAVRAQLELLKQDRSTYLKPQDVFGLYDQVIQQVEQLNSLRTTKRLEQNRVDTVLDDCFQLISLSFLTIGKNNEAPAIYSAVSTMKRLLDHLKEVAFFSPKDLESISHKLLDYRECVERGRDQYSPHLLTLLEARIEVCQNILAELQDALSRLTEELKPKYETLVSIIRSLSACNIRSKFPSSEVQKFHSQLKGLEASLEKKSEFTGEADVTERLVEKIKDFRIGAVPPPPADQLVSDLLTRCYLWVDVITERQGRMDARFQDVCDKLLGIRNRLEKISLTQAWSLRETDLYSYQRQLDRIDESRVDGDFVDALGRPGDLYVQRTLLYLLRKSYALIYHLIITSEPVSEALLTYYNQLSTLKSCLLKVKEAGGVSSTRELYPYSMKLTSIDNMRVDGKFMIGSEIPDGQAAVVQLLEDCFDLAYELRGAAEEEERAAAARDDGDGDDRSSAL